MSRKEDKKLGLADLASATKSMPLKLGLKFPTLQRRSFLTRRDLDEVKAGTEERLPELASYVGEMGEVLSDPELGQKQDHVVRQAERDTAEFVRQCPETTREELAIATFEVAVEKFPDSSMGLNHIADFGKALGILTETVEKDTRVVSLPLSRDDGRWAATPLTTRVRGASVVFTALVAKAERVALANASAAEEAISRLREGTTGSFLDVLRGGGETVVFIPGNRVGERYYGGGHIRIRVDGGKIIPVNAVGKCRGTVAEAVELGIRIPVSTLGKERLELSVRLDESKFKVALTLFFFLNRGYQLALENAERSARIAKMREKATISGVEFVVDGKPGTAYLFMRDGWKAGDKFFRYVAFLAERDVEGNIRVVETLTECGELFGGSSREWKPAGDRFSGLGYPLGSVLRTLFATMVRGRPRPNGETSNTAPLSGADTAAS